MESGVTTPSAAAVGSADGALVAGADACVGWADAVALGALDGVGAALAVGVVVGVTVGVGVGVGVAVGVALAVGVGVGAAVGADVAVGVAGGGVTAVEGLKVMVGVVVTGWPSTVADITKSPATNDVNVTV